MNWEKSTRLYELEGCLVIPFHEDANVKNVSDLSTDALDMMESVGLQNVIMDMSGVSILDRKTFKLISNAAEMIKLMGGDTVFAGIQPGVASVIVDLGMDSEGMSTAFSIKEGVQLFQKKEEY
jgi:anti-anti-sigma regulatory factor